MKIDCACCGYTTACKLVEDDWTDDTHWLCSVCHRAKLRQLTEALPESHKHLPAALGLLVNAMTDAHGISYRESMEAVLNDREPEGGSYESF